jgi:hypothetical protein
VLSPIFNLLQVMLIRNVMTAIYKDISDSNLGYQMYYSQGMASVDCMTHAYMRLIASKGP